MNAALGIKRAWMGAGGIVAALLLFSGSAWAQATTNSVLMCKNFTTGVMQVCNGTTDTGIPVSLVAGSASIGTVAQGNSGTNAQSWWFQQGDGTRGPVTVKAASTAPVATDIAETVTQRPDGATVAGASVGTAGTPSTNVISIQGVASGTVVPSNLAQVNGVTTLTGSGATGTGAQRVTTAQDTTTIAGSAPGTAGTPSTNVVSVQGVASGTVIPIIGFSSGPVTATATPANSSHASGTSIGGLFSLAVGRANGTSGRVTNFSWASQGTSTGQLVVRIWDRNPTNTTCTDNSAFVGSATDDARLIAGVPFAITPAAPAVTTGDTYSYAAVGGVSWEYLTSGNTTLYVCAITVATDTADQNKLVRVMLSGPQN